MDAKLLDSDIAGHGQRLVHAAKDRALDLAPTSLDQAHELADRLHDRYRDQVPELEKQLSKRAKKMERKLEKQARRLPVDTPFDQRRRHRTRRRGTGIAFVALALAGAAAYVMWRRRRGSTDADIAPERADSTVRQETSGAPTGAGAGSEDRLTVPRPRA